MKDAEYNSRQFTMPLPEHLYGGCLSGGVDPSCTVLSSIVQQKRDQARDRAEASIKRLEERTGKQAYDKVYLDGMIAKGDVISVRVRIQFKLIAVPVLKLVHG